MTRALTLLVCVLISGCRPSDPPHSEVSPDPGETVKVVGYRFLVPGEGDPDTSSPSGFTLIDESGALDSARLRELKVREVTLSDDQRERLVEAVDGRHPATKPAACYDPHHVFVFYDASDRVTRVVEICFGCLNVHTSPELEESRWRRHDFRGLARLCDEIGIGLTSGTAQDLVRFWDETSRLGSRQDD